MFIPRSLNYEYLFNKCNRYTLNQMNAYNHTSNYFFKNIVDILSRNATNFATDNFNKIIKI